MMTNVLQLWTLPTYAATRNFSETCLPMLSTYYTVCQHASGGGKELLHIHWEIFPMMGSAFFAH